MKKLKEIIDDIFWNIRYYLVYYPVYYPRNVFFEIKYFIQRGRRGYSDRDCWHVSYYLSKILPDMLRAIKDENNEKWNELMEKMAQGFEADTEAEEIMLQDIVKSDKYEQLKKQGRVALRLLVKHYDELIS